MTWRYGFQWGGRKANGKSKIVILRGNSMNRDLTNHSWITTKFTLLPNFSYMIKCVSIISCLGFGFRFHLKFYFSTLILKSDILFFIYFPFNRSRVHSAPMTFNKDQIFIPFILVWEWVSGFLSILIRKYTTGNFISAMPDINRMLDNGRCC